MTILTNTLSRAIWLQCHVFHFYLISSDFQVPGKVFVNCLGESLQEGLWELSVKQTVIDDTCMCVKCDRNIIDKHFR